MDASTTTPRADKLGILVWLGTFLGPSVMKNSHRRYAYEPLDEDSIRLITIKPGPWDSIIECEVDTKRLGQGESRFRALSYVWGDSNVRRTIHLNGTEFEVTVNLFDGLRQIRKSMFEDGTLRQLPIWADAICINQEDKEEKAKQVPNMHQIYSTAKEVLLWLGAMPIPPDFLEAYTFGEFRQLLGFRDEDCPMSEELRERFLEAYVMGARSTEFFDILVDRRLPVRYKLMFTAMASALRRCSYFQRVWTVQEAVLAKDKPVILVNRHVLSWDEFAHRIDERTEKLSDVSNRPHSSFSGISSLRVQRARRGPRLVHHRLLDLVEDFSDLSCTEPVDKIYGLLAMVPLHRFPKSLRPDYNISCEEVYWKYAEYIFYTTGNLTLLDKCKGNLPGVPSWVPAIGTTEETISEVKSKTFRKSDAPPRAYPSFSDDSREMSITGYNYGVCMDRMVRPLDVLRPEDLELVGTSMDLRDTMCQLRKKITEPIGIFGEDHWKSVTGAGRQSPKGFHAEAGCRKTLFELAQNMDLSEMQDFCSRDPKFAKCALEGWRELAAFAWTSLRTSKGQVFTFRDSLWLNDRQPRKGDQIFKPDGMESIVVLRPESNGRFRLVGKLTARGRILTLEGRSERVVLI